MSKKNTWLLIGTGDGVYRAPIDRVDDANRILESELVLRVRRFGDDVFAASRSGLFHSTDAGVTWTDLDVPRREVYSVLASPDSERVYAGTHPAHLYVLTDSGTSWQELEGLQNLPSRGTWHTPRHRNEAHVRSLGAHSDTPERVVAGVEVGGVRVSNDHGETWTEQRDGLQIEREDNLQYDVHHILVVSDDGTSSCVAVDSIEPETPANPGHGSTITSTCTSGRRSLTTDGCTRRRPGVPGPARWTPRCSSRLMEAILSNPWRTPVLARGSFSHGRLLIPKAVTCSLEPIIERCSGE